MADTKITVAGLTSSGKTCYLTGMYYRMSAGLKNFTLSTDEDSDLYFERQWEKMCNSSLGDDRFPPLTDQVSKYDFKLKYSFKEIINFEWIDYPGGSLKFSSTENEMTADFMENLKESSCLILFIDGKIFSKDVDDPALQLLQNGARTYTKLINIFEEENESVPPVVIVITKYDLCSRSSEEVKNYIKEGFPVLFTPAEQDGYEKLVSIIPVTLGKNITENNYRGEVNPRHIHLPIAFAIWCTLKNYIGYVEAENDSVTSRIADNSRGLIQRWINKSEIESMRHSIEINNLVLERLSNDAARLLNELNQNKIPTFLNGTEVDLASIM